MDERWLIAQKKANELVDTIKQITYPDDFSRLERIAIADGDKYIFIAQHLYQLYTCGRLKLNKENKIPSENFLRLLSILDNEYKNKAFRNLEKNIVLESKGWWSSLV